MNCFYRYYSPMVRIEQIMYYNTIDQLLAMGIASKKAAFLMPREMWSMLPGGMPYFVVKDI